MPVTFVCPRCTSLLQTDITNAGTTMMCSICSNKLIVPARIELEPTAVRPPPFSVGATTPNARDPESCPLSSGVSDAPQPSLLASAAPRRSPPPLCSARPTQTDAITTCSFQARPARAGRASLRRNQHRPAQWIALGASVSVATFVVVTLCLATFWTGADDGDLAGTRPEDGPHTNGKTGDTGSPNEREGRRSPLPSSVVNASRPTQTGAADHGVAATSANALHNDVTAAFEALGYFHKDTKTDAKDNSYVGVVVSIPKGLLMPTSAEFTRLLQEDRRRNAGLKNDIAPEPPKSAAHVIVLAPSFFTMEFEGGRTVDADSFLMPHKGATQSLSSHSVTITQYAREEINRDDTHTFCVGAIDNHNRTDRPVRVRYKQHPPVAVAPRLFTIAELPRLPELESFNFAIPRIHIPSIPSYTPPTLPPFNFPVVPK